MNFNKISYIAILIIFSSLTSFASDNEDEQYQRWMEELNNYKQDFLTKEMDLNSGQVEKFFPLYHEMEKRIFDANKGARDLLKDTNENIEEKRYQDVVTKVLDLKNEEAEIEKEYYEKFSDILSYKQLFLLQRGEIKFSKIMLKHHKISNNKSN